jgi:hypothetical protein
MSDNVEVNEGEGLGAPAIEPQLTEIEARAVEQGWRPKDEWDGEPDDWRTAREFLDRGEFFKKIDDQNRTIKELRKTQADFAKHYERMKKTEFERALEVLKAQKRIALQEQDADAVVDIDEKMAETKEAMKNIEVPQVPQDNAAAELNPIFVAWKERNGWYETNPAMKAYADTLGNSIKGMSPTDLLAEVERQVKKEFAHKFQNPARKQAPTVESSGARGTTGRKETFQLSEDERRVMQRFVRQGILTEEQYMKDLKEAKARGQ